MNEKKMKFICLKDFNITGSLLISCGIDHSLKIWDLQSQKIQDAIKESNIHNKYEFQLITLS